MIICLLVITILKGDANVDHGFNSVIGVLAVRPEYLLVGLHH